MNTFRYSQSEDIFARIYRHIASYLLIHIKCYSLMKFKCKIYQETGPRVRVSYDQQIDDGRQPVSDPRRRVPRRAPSLDEFHAEYNTRENQLLTLIFFSIPSIKIAARNQLANSLCHPRSSIPKTYCLYSWLRHEIGSAAVAAVPTAAVRTRTHSEEYAELR